MESAQLGPPQPTESQQNRNGFRKGLSAEMHRCASAYQRNHVRDTRFTLDSRSALKAFRLIGGFDGIEIDELRKAISGIPDSNVRAPLLKNLTHIFSQCDEDRNGIIDFLEFEHMMQSSTILQQAVYDLLERADEEERNEYIGDDGDANLSAVTMNSAMDVASVTLTLIYVISLAIQLDVSPNWSGWDFIECLFLGLFSIEIFSRCLMEVYNQPFSKGQAVLEFFTQPFIIFDVVVVSIGWIEVVILLLNSDSEGHILDLNWTRLLRFVRCFRLVRILWYCHELRVLLEGILSGMKSAVWGLALIFVIILIWAIVIRTGVENKWAQDPYSDEVARNFPNMPESLLKVFRCMAINADSACVEKPSEFGWFFNALWAVSEAFILVGIINVVASIYVVQAVDNDQKIKQSINNASFRADVLRLQQLDKLLRLLINPGREQSNPKERNAHEVAEIIREEHPEVAAKMPSLELQIVDFAQHIQEAKKVHQSAMDYYETNEYTECKELRNLPSAKTFMTHHNQEALMINSEDASTANTLMLPLAPSGARQVLLVQDIEDLERLLEEAQEVQQIVKSMIYPDSTWALTQGSAADPAHSGDIWKASKGICDEAIDPGLKSRERIAQKVHGKYGGQYNRNRDYCRLALIYNTVRHLIHAIPRFLEFRLDIEGFQVVSLENRFVEPHPLGWRDVTLLLSVRVPSSEIVDGIAESHHIMELQLRLRQFAEICHLGHHFYTEIRNQLPEDLVHLILDLLVTDTTLDLGITKVEWLQCLPNKEVKKMLDALGIPKRCRKGLFDVIDIDGSGTVTSSELKEMLLLVKDPVNAHEMAGCHFRVRDIQRQLQSRLEPQLSMMSNIAVRAMEENERHFEDLSTKINRLEAMDHPAGEALKRRTNLRHRQSVMHQLGSGAQGSHHSSVRSSASSRKTNSTRPMNNTRLRRSRSSPAVLPDQEKRELSTFAETGSGQITDGTFSPAFSASLGGGLPSSSNGTKWTTLWSNGTDANGSHPLPELNHLKKAFGNDTGTESIAVEVAFALPPSEDAKAHFKNSSQGVAIEGPLHVAALVKDGGVNLRPSGMMRSVSRGGLPSQPETTLQTPRTPRDLDDAKTPPSQNGLNCRVG